MGRGQLMVSFTSFSDTDLTNGPNFDNYYTGKEVTYFGCPSTDGEDGLFAELDFALGICVNSEHKEACWDFVRDMLLNSGDPTLPAHGPAAVPPWHLKRRWPRAQARRARSSTARRRWRNTAPSSRVRTV